MRELNRDGATICMVTHDPRYAKHADRTIHMFDGRVVDDVPLPYAEPAIRESGFELR
jgi:putative ABC transport system ATP-binding protein